ncbi:MAG: hypothetical protein JF886_15010 [Candidatus Dormibacteraeota bacterium]|uniref:Uncharacterized protein n=1 Tax=Candidatus Aeolococcus gillhamiae TaxID=3127015 RepID=A0A934K5V2_9BACT|nr:hypothetical protein [Candidatus Dormibacteraeota bacterium]
MTEERRPTSTRRIGATARTALTGLSAGLVATVLLAVAASVVTLALAFGSRPPQASVAPVLSVGGVLVGVPASPAPAPGGSPTVTPSPAPLRPSAPSSVSAPGSVSIIAPQRPIVVLPPPAGDRETPDPSASSPTPGPDG